MLLWEGIRLALRSMATHKLRTFLTLLANIVAVSSVIAVVSILGGMDRYVKETIAGQGTGIITLTRVDLLRILSNLDEFIESLRNPRITLDDLDYLRANLERGVEDLDVQVSPDRSERMSYRSRYLDGLTIEGRTAQYPVFRDDALHAGRHFTALEVEAKSPVTVVGWDVADNLFPDEDPIGKTLQVGRRHFRIIGVYEKQATGLGRDRNRLILVPVTTFQKIYGTRQSLDILVKVEDLALIPEVVDDVTTLMRVRHRLRPRERNDFEVTTAEGLVTLWESFSRLFFFVLVALTAISLVIGGIILMNIMLVSVTERVREIGLRKALGAKRSSILWQILVESTTLSSAGGLVGIVLGFLVASVVSALSPLPYTIAPWAIAAGILVTVGTGVFFGIYPANQAARLDPIEALHHE